MNFIQITTIDDPIHDEPNYVELAWDIRGEEKQDDDDDENNNGNEGDEVDQDSDFNDHDDDHDHDLKDDVGVAS